MDLFEKHLCSLFGLAKPGRLSKALVATVLFLKLLTPLEELTCSQLVKAFFLVVQEAFYTLEASRIEEGNALDMGSTMVVAYSIEKVVSAGKIIEAFEPLAVARLEAKLCWEFTEVSRALKFEVYFFLLHMQVKY